MSRTRKVTPGITGTARVGRRGPDPVADLLSRLQPGDVAVLDRADVSRDRAAALVDAGVRVVVSGAPLRTGRYASHGPELLAEAGVVIVDGVGADAVARLAAEADGQPVRVHDGVVHAAGPGDGGGGEVLAAGRVVDPGVLSGRPGRPERPDTPTVAVGETGQFPELTTDLTGRAVVVVVEVRQAELAATRRLLTGGPPVVVALGRAADDLLEAGWAPDVVITTRDAPPSPEVGDAVRDVVVLDGGEAPEALALRLARARAALVVGVGLSAPADVPLLDASTLPALTGGHGPDRTLALVLVLGVLALLLAVAVTPIGHGWLTSLGDTLQGLL